MYVCEQTRFADLHVGMELACHMGEDGYQPSGRIVEIRGFDYAGDFYFTVLRADGKRYEDREDANRIDNDSTIGIAVAV